VHHGTARRHSLALAAAAAAAAAVAELSRQLAYSLIIYRASRSGDGGDGGVRNPAAET